MIETVRDGGAGWMQLPNSATSATGEREQRLPCLFRDWVCVEVWSNDGTKKKTPILPDHVPLRKPKKSHDSIVWSLSPARPSCLEEEFCATCGYVRVWGRLMPSEAGGKLETKKS